MLDYLKEYKGLKPYVGVYKHGEKNINVIIWAKNKEEAKEEISQLNKDIPLSKVKEVTIDVVEKFYVEQQKSFDWVKKGFDDIQDEVKDKVELGTDVFRGIINQIAINMPKNWENTKKEESKKDKSKKEESKKDKSKKDKK
ncbi:MAG: hypothetical protein GQ557_00235 [Mycoplasmataceae bacterium]|nr:hypothetical protein [Mycoplasmataceae bacterium]